MSREAPTLDNARPTHTWITRCPPTKRRTTVLCVASPQLFAKVQTADGLQPSLAVTASVHGTAPAVRVLLVEDFEPFRRAIRLILGKHGGLQIVGEASDGLEGVVKTEELQPDLILLEIGLPTLDGIEAARKIRTSCLASRIIFVTQESGEYFAQEAFRIGAVAYVRKIGVVRELLPAVDAALDGGQFLSFVPPEQVQTVSPD